MSKTNKHTRKMKNVHIPIFCIFITLFCCLTACSSRDRYPEAMRQATRCLEDQPDSALCYLSSLDATIGKEAEETRMYHALLKLRAEDKLYIDQTSDSLITRIVAYYDRHGDADKRLEAYYMLGRVYRTLEDPLAALWAFRQAYEVGEESERFGMLGRICEQTGYLLAYQDLDTEALEAVKKATRYYELDHDTVGISYSLRNQARLYLEQNRRDSVESLYREAIRLALVVRDSSVAHAISGEFAAMLINMSQDYDESGKILSSLPEDYKKRNAIILKNIGDIYLYRFYPDSARHYYQLALNAEEDKNIYLEKAIYQLLANMDSTINPRSAFHYERLASVCSDSILGLKKAEAIKKYNYQQTKIVNQRLQIANARHQSVRWLLGFLLLFVSAILVFIVNYYWRKSRSLKLRALQIQRLSQKQESLLNEAITHLKIELRQVKSSDEELILNLKERLRQHEQTLRQIQDEQERQVNSLKASEIFRFFSNPQNQNHRVLTSDKWLELQMAIDRTYPNFTALLQTYCLSITERDLQLCYLVKIGISPNGIASIFDCSPQAVASKRSRLYEKILKLKKGEGKAKDFDKFILNL